MRRPYPFQKGRGRVATIDIAFVKVYLSIALSGVHLRRTSSAGGLIPLLPGYRGAAATPTLGRNVTSVTRHDDYRPRLSPSFGPKEGERDEISRKIPDAILCQDDARPIRETEVEIALEIEPDHSERV